MKLSISNIAWDYINNEEVFNLMNKYCFLGLEIAPTKIFPQNPYDELESAKTWAQTLKKDYNLTISSMQSIWFGKNEKIFNTKEERKILTNYTKKAIDFASAIDCKNLVFGCPKNRNTEKKEDYKIAIEFFKELGDYAYSKNTTIGMEANPAIYNTNFINDTKSAINLIKEIGSKGFLLNLDFGTIIQNNEDLNILKDNVFLINHVHISEPYLALIQEREEHKTLIEILKNENYKNFISIEMKQQEKIEDIEKIMKYLKELI